MSNVRPHMGAPHLFGLLFNPLSVALLLFVVAGVTHSQLNHNNSEWQPSPYTLTKGYALALVAAMPAAYIISYTSPEMASAKFNVAP